MGYIYIGGLMGDIYIYLFIHPKKLQFAAYWQLVLVLEWKEFKQLQFFSLTGINVVSPKQLLNQKYIAMLHTINFNNTDDLD